MKDIELKLVSELMKNSRRSDRQLAKILGVSQPTVTRMIRRFEQEGIVREYTVIPDFCKLGYRIMALIFIKLKSGLDPETVERTRQYAKETIKKGPFEIVMVERGLGLSHSGVVISYHEDYSSFLELEKWFSKFDFIDAEKSEAFLVDLNDKIHYRPFSFLPLADHILTLKREEEGMSAEQAQPRRRRRRG